MRRLRCQATTLATIVIPAYALALAYTPATAGSDHSRRHSQSHKSLATSGTWLAGHIVDPSKQTAPADLEAQLKAARLPLPGETVRAGHGQFCAGSISCDAVVWKTTTLSDLDDGRRLIEDTGLLGSTRVYQGRGSNRWIVYTVIARPDGTLLARVPLCRDYQRAMDCRNGFEPWRPLTKSSKRSSSN